MNDLAKPAEPAAAVLGSSLATLSSPAVVPALVAQLGDHASWRYIEFFTAHMRNPNTRRAYARACARFFAWCDERGLALASIRPFDVAAWIEGLQQHHSAPGVKQQLAAVRMLFDWLITGQVVPMNPAALADRAEQRAFGDPGRLDPSEQQRHGVGPQEPDHAGALLIGLAAADQECAIAVRPGLQILAP